MRIKVLSRRFFENIKGTEEEYLIFKRCNIISINTPEYNKKNIIKEQPPFSKKYLECENLLIEYFHDWCTPLEDVVLISDTDVDNIYKFVCEKIDKNKILLVHCTAGISRSGAIGYVLNEYFNKYLTNNVPNEDYNIFKHSYEGIISPNDLVKEKLLKKFNIKQ